MGLWWGKTLGWKWSDPDLPAIYSQIYLGDSVTEKLDYQTMHWTIKVRFKRLKFAHTSYIFSLDILLPFFNLFSRKVLGWSRNIW